MVDGDLEAADDLGQGLFSSPKASLYRGPFTKVVLFDLAVSMATIRPKLYSRNFIPVI